MSSHSRRVSECKYDNSDGVWLDSLRGVDLFEPNQRASCAANLDNSGSGRIFQHLGGSKEFGGGL